MVMKLMCRGQFLRFSCALAIGLCGCGAASVAGKGHVVGRSKEVALASQSNARLTGSSQINNTDGAPMICQDFLNPPDSEQEALERDRCRASGASWSDAACSVKGRIGGCKSKVDENGALVIQWYYIAAQADEARELCKGDGPSEWLE